MSISFRPIIRHGLRRGLSSRAGFSRREILTLGATAAAGALLSPLAGCATRPRTTRIADQSLRVVVIGGGFAGLACADTLARGGADVIVLEASGRVGGRVLTDRRFLPGRSVELGGEFIGTNHPTWISYAKRFGIGLVPAMKYEGEEPILLGGRVIRGMEADRLFEKVDAQLATLIELARPVDPVRPWKSPNAAELDRTSVLAFLSPPDVADDTRQLLAALVEADNGVPPERMSFLALLAMVAGGGFADYFELSETHRAVTGNDALATALANAIGERVRLNAAALSIRRERERAVVTAARGRPIECDAVVLAVAPTVWHRIAFDGPLGKRVPQMGRNVKLVTRVDHPVWEHQQLSPQSVSDGLVQLTWVSAENAPGLPKAMTLFSGGRAADRLRQIDPSRRKSEALEALRPVYPTLAGAVSANRFVDWPGMTVALGSYSFPAPGEVGRYGPTLVDGVNDGLAPLRFAGEHTSYAFMGYMEGALSSGVRAAESLLARHGASQRPAAVTSRASSWSIRP